MAKQDGTVDVWDLMDRSNEAALSVRVNSTPVVAVKFWPSGDEKRQLLAAGDASGTLHVLDLPEAARKPVPRESELMEAFLGRRWIASPKQRARTASRDEEARRLEEEAAAAKEAAEAAEVKAQAKKGKKGRKGAHRGPHGGGVPRARGPVHVADGPPRPAGGGLAMAKGRRARAAFEEVPGIFKRLALESSPNVVRLREAASGHLLAITRFSALFSSSKVFVRPLGPRFVFARVFFSLRRLVLAFSLFAFFLFGERLDRREELGDAEPRPRLQPELREVHLPARQRRGEPLELALELRRAQGLLEVLRVPVLSGRCSISLARTSSPRSSGPTVSDVNTSPRPGPRALAHRRDPVPRPSRRASPPSRSRRRSPIRLGRRRRVP